MTSDPLIDIRNVYKWYGRHLVLNGVSLKVDRGQVACIIGPSGAGKSTLLRAINHLEDIDRGRIYLDGELVGYVQHKSKLRGLPEAKLSAQRATMGMVFQSFNLFPHLSVMQNIIEAPVGVLKKPRGDARKEALELLKAVGLSDKADAYPRQLSGGQQQRVAIARALAMNPKVLLFDEPTSALDPELVGEVLNVVRALVGRGYTMVLVTHEISFAREVADTVVFMDEGQIVEVGTPAEVLDDPCHARTRSFLSKVL